MQTTFFQQDAEPFWDRIAPRYAKKSISDPVAYEEKLSCVRRLLTPTDHILEIGCGTGGTALRLASNVSQITATDVSRRMIEIARSKLILEGVSNIAFQRADAADLVAGHPIDAICAFSLLHLVDDIGEVLKCAHQQLKPGGLLISKTVCLGDGALLIRTFVRLLTAMGLAPRVNALSRGELIQHLEDAGFEIEAVSHFGQQHTNPFIIARKPAA